MYYQTRAFSTVQQVDPFHRVVRTVDELGQAIRFLSAQPLVAVDTETSGLAWMRHARPCGISMSAWGEHGRPQCFYFPYAHQTGERQLPREAVVQACGQVLHNPNITKVLHHLKFDEHQLHKDGLKIIGPRRDTMIEAHLWDENSKVGLKERAATDLNDPRAHAFESILDREVTRLAKEARMGKNEFRDRYGYARVDTALCGTYAAWDVDFTLRLAAFYDSHGVRQFYKGVYDTEMDLTRVLFDMEEIGVPVDADYFRRLGATLQTEMEVLKRKMRDMLGDSEFNPGSDDEVIHVLTRRLGLKLTKLTEKGRIAVDKEVLEEFDEVPLCVLIQEYRDAAKIHGTYAVGLVERLGDDGLLHGDYQQVGTNTGRLSCKDPNMQNLVGDSDKRALAATGKKVEDGGKDPWSIKRGFINRPGGYVSGYFDYSQIELRVLAAYSRDRLMVDAYANDEDVHSLTAMQVFGAKDKASRKKAKTINFGLMYMMGPGGYSRKAKVTFDQAKLDMARFFERFPDIGKFRDDFFAACQRNGNTFVNWFGRPRRIPNLSSSDKWERKRAQRQAIGSLIQGTAAELTKVSLVRIWKWEQQARSGTLICQTIHDDIRLDMPAAYTREIVRTVVPLMEDFQQFRPIPILTDAKWSSTDWGEKRDFPKDWVNHVWTFPAKRAAA